MSEELVKRLLEGDRRAVAKLISLVENDSDFKAAEIMRLLHQHTKKAYIVGITGAPGSGKSTLVDRITHKLRSKEKTVGIIAVDPTSPFTGGALLGDRIRMKESGTDKGVFIRSMGTRGSLGGLSRATNNAIRILDAFGKDFILVETVGAGQSEVDIVNSAYTSIVILVPGMGDEIQAIKAGILEIGDIFVVNKADRDGADRAVMELEMMLDLNLEKNGWRPPVIKTIATKDEGIDELLDCIEGHMNYLMSNNSLEKRKEYRIEIELMNLLSYKINKYILDNLKQSGSYDELLKKICAQKMDIYSAADEILKVILHGERDNNRQG